MSQKIIDLEQFKRWMVSEKHVACRSEANELCVSGWQSDIARYERLLRLYIRAV